MSARTFELFLESDVVVSALSATEGGHRTLGFIPGAALLGCCAARLYESLSSEDRFIAFHSGKVRFGNGLPLMDGVRTVPVPLAWMARKGSVRRVTGEAVPEMTLSGVAPRTEPGAPGADGGPEDGDAPGMEQFRDGFVSVDGRWCSPPMRYRLKTAVQPGTGRAAEGRLFGYQSIAAGTRMAFDLSWDNGVDDGLIDQLTLALTGLIHVGRSRSAEYGRVRCRPCGRGYARRSVNAGGEEVSLLCLSDVALFDEFGQPTLDARAATLGLPEGTRSGNHAVRVRRYAPFNGHRRHRDVERFVIAAGSVLRYRLPSDASPEEIVESLKGGIGVFRQDGLGEVWVNSPLVHAAPMKFLGAEEVFGRGEDPVSARIEETPYAKALVAWIGDRSALAEKRERAMKRADTLVAGLKKAYRAAWAIAGAGDEERVGPSASQWNRVREVSLHTHAKTGGLAAALDKALFESDDGPCKKKDEDWGVAFYLQEDAGGAAETTFRKWFRTLFKERIAKSGADDEDIRRTLALFAGGASRWLAGDSSSRSSGAGGERASARGDSTKGAS